MLRTISITMAILSLAGAAALAEVPSGVTYQGRLVDASGSPVTDGTYSLRFAIYSAAAGGSALWESGYRPVTVTAGLFTYVLGSHAPFPQNLFADSARWLGVTVSGEAEITPRMRLSGTPYALQARAADSAETVHWSDILGVPADVGGAVTQVIAGSGLAGGGTGGTVTLSIPTYGVKSSHIALGAVGSAQIGGGAVSSGQILDNSIETHDIGDDAGAVGSYSGAVTLPDWGASFTSDAVIDSVVVNAPTAGVVLLIASGWFVLQHTTGIQESFARMSMGTNNFGGVIDLENFTSFSVPGAAATGTYRAPFSLVALEPIAGGGRRVFYLRGARQTGTLCDVGDAHFEAVFLAQTYGTVEAAPSPTADPEQGRDAFGEPSAR